MKSSRLGGKNPFGDGRAGERIAACASRIIYKPTGDSGARIRERMPLIFW